MRVSHLMLYEMVGAGHSIDSPLEKAIWLFSKDYPVFTFDKDFCYRESDDIHIATRLLDTFTQHPFKLFIEFVRYVDSIAQTCRKRTDYVHGSIYDKELTAFEDFIKVLHRFANGELVWFPPEKAKKAEKNRKKKERRRARSRSVSKDVDMNHFEELVLKLVDSGK